MLIYIFLLIYLLIFGFVFGTSKNVKTKKNFVIASIIILTIVSALRASSVGSDTLQYCNAFKYLFNFEHLNFDALRYEKGFTLFLWVIHKLSSEPNVLLIISSLLINLGICRFIIKNSDNMILSLILYFICNFYFAYMNIMRQALSIVLILYGYEFLKKDRKIIFSIFVLFASLFHFSAVLAFIYLPLQKFKYNKNMIITVSVLSIIGFIFGNDLFAYLGTLSSRVNDYIGSQYDVQNYFGALLEFLLNLISFGFGILVIRKNKPEVFNDKKNNLNLIVGIMSINTIISALVMKVSIFNRFSTYFSIFNIIWIANCLTIIKEPRKKIVYSMMFLLIYVLYFLAILIYRPEWYSVVPYTFYK